MSKQCFIQEIVAKKINRSKINNASRSSWFLITQTQFSSMRKPCHWISNSHAVKISKPNSTTKDCSKFMWAGSVHWLTGSLAISNSLSWKKPDSEWLFCSLTHDCAIFPFNARQVHFLFHDKKCTSSWLFPTCEVTLHYINSNKSKTMYSDHKV